MIAHTCNWGSCAFRKKLKLKTPDECLNYYENIFLDEKGEKSLIRDCAPVRTMLMIQELFDRTIGVQKAAEQGRNQVAGLVAIMQAAVEHAQKKQLSKEDGETIDITPEEEKESEPGV